MADNLTPEQRAWIEDYRTRAESVEGTPTEGLYRAQITAFFEAFPKRPEWADDSHILRLSCDGEAYIMYRFGDYDWRFSNSPGYLSYPAKWVAEETIVRLPESVRAQLPKVSEW